ncbi:hypothetical protein B0J12DRAFT_686562 [Macrophomina phaseolina]|uniref:Uncharacterized protein n=1 Tax=Macrophomina phaseolina TaxID=35725 RepID=A0ABQ8FT31_9PEZI|nr:hypothetical protein B0J12DRAFT_686562 [Macrophomina phaseolina]
MLRFGQKPLLEQPPTDLDVAKLADLHSSISRFAGISYLAQYQSYMSQALYYQWFESAVQERSKLMKIARAERDKVAQRIRRRHRSGIEPPQRGQKLKDELVNHLVHMNKDRETVSRELENNIRKGKILNLLLSPPDNPIKTIEFNEALLDSLGNLFLLPDEITIYLKDAYDGELWDIKPFDVTRFFEPVGRIVTTPRRLEFL